MLLLASIGAAVLAGYAIHLDKRVRAEFEGARWTLPAKVYARPLTLYAGLDLSREQLIYRLERQGYRPSQTLDSTGTYRTPGDALEIHVRGFAYWDGYRPARKIKLTFNGDGVAGLKAIDGQSDLALIRLDPLLIGSIYPVRGAGEDRILVNLKHVPDLLPAGLIAVEDKNFMEHWGVSITGILRAAWADLKAGAIVQGGSTLTQQLIKNMYLNNQQTFVRKAKEALMAILLEMHYSKAAIMEAYLNEVYLGQDGRRAIHGFGLASYFYFQKPLSELRPRAIALLVAMVKGPSYYNPRRYPDRALARRNLVLDIFHDSGLIEDAAWKQAKASELGVTGESQIATARYPAFIDLVKRQLHDQYDEQDLTEDGLRVFTTLVPSVQTTVQKQVAKGVTTVEKARGIDKGMLQSAAIVTSVEGAHVLGLVGGRNPGYAGFNRALDARRQIGSTMKPVVYLTALLNPDVYNVLTPLDDSPLRVELPNGDVWAPENYSHRSHGTQVPMYYALEHSYNLATARMALNIGIPNVIDTLQALGYPGDPLAVPSLALGAVGMSPFQVAQIYNTIAAGGYYTPLTAITAVTTAQGEPLTRHQMTIERVIDNGPVYLLTWMMRRVARFGTGSNAYRVLPSSFEFAAKTGTSDGGRDGWFSGFTENRVIIVWTGNDDNKSMGLTGATAALPIWSRIVKHIDARSLVPVPPSNIVSLPLRLIYEPGLASLPSGSTLDYSQNCNNTTPVPFMAGHVPAGLEQCDSGIMSRNNASTPAEEEPGWFEQLFR